MTDDCHISDRDLERLILGTITEEAELAPLEEHVLACTECISRGGGTLLFVEAMRTALRRRQARGKGPESAEHISDDNLERHALGAVRTRPNSRPRRSICWRVAGASSGPKLLGRRSRRCARP